MIDYASVLSNRLQDELCLDSSFSLEHTSHGVRQEPFGPLHQINCSAGTAFTHNAVTTSRHMDEHRQFDTSIRSPLRVVRKNFFRCSLKDLALTVIPLVPVLSRRRMERHLS